MLTFIYRCPKTGFKVQGWIADEPADSSAIVPVTCLACSSTHLVNPATGRSPGDEKSSDN
jgi:hypothetical protein